ncbi:adenosine kinase-like [Belonocnema kinseyi]|uniref:adenosine kinase-like n=1 Tax=Belonocnema kinseyi TaxID=2817044 RepID=UPI00143D3A60|nr:adenosine kinase-like [Belonocnema kinseyi]
MSVPILRVCPQLPAVIAFGNPLLDIIVRMKGMEAVHAVHLLNKYNLKMDGQSELSADEMHALLEYLPQEFEQTPSPGGCAQNTLRMLQWLCGGPNEPHVGVFYGGLGKDARGVTLEKIVRAAGVDVQYALHPTLPTGISVNLVTDSWQTLTANLGAAGVYTLHNLHNSSLPLDTVKIIYIEGFFITHSLDVAREVVKRVKGRDVIIVFNLCGDYIFDNHLPAILEMVGISKIVFGNAQEMKMLAFSLNIHYEDAAHIPFYLNSINKVTVSISSSESKDWLSTDGIFVMTQGGQGPAIAVWGHGQSVQVPPIVPKAPIVDTTGAGDALVAGFLAGILARKDPKTCLEWGSKMASLIITRLGVTIPNGIQPDFLQ